MYRIQFSKKLDGNRYNYEIWDSVIVGHGGWLLCADYDEEGSSVPTKERSYSPNVVDYFEPRQ